VARAARSGFHHAGIFTRHLHDDVARLEARDIEVIQSGRGFGAAGDEAVAYLDSAARLGLALELIEVPRARRKPDREWTNAPARRLTRGPYVAATVAVFTPIRSPDSASNRRSDSSRTRN
jgi:hypothetical protein